MKGDAKNRLTLISLRSEALFFLSSLMALRRSWGREGEGGGGGRGREREREREIERESTCKLTCFLTHTLSLSLSLTDIHSLFSASELK